MNSNEMYFLLQSLQWNPVLLMRFLWTLQIENFNQVIHENFSTEKKFPTVFPTESNIEQVTKKSSITDQYVQKQHKTMPTKHTEWHQDQKNSENDFHPRKQKSGRNIRSNALKYFIKYIQSYENGGNKIQRLINFCEIKQYTVENFLQALKSKFEHCRNYIRPNYIKEIIRDQDQNFAKIFRILLRTFVKHYRMLFLVHCKKLKYKAKFSHARVIKKLFKQFIA